MDNIKKFEDFLDRMQGLLDSAKKQGHIIVRVEDLENTFPELKESEDEKIKEIIRLALESCNTGQGYIVCNDNYAKCLAWLEKQGEQKPTLEDTAKAFLEALSETPYNNTPIVEAQIITKQLLIFLSAPKSYNPDAINEQKPNDNVEPKFKVGDWITIKE